MITIIFAPPRTGKKILKYIFKNMKKKFKEIDKEEKAHIRQVNKELLKLEKQKKLTTKQKQPSGDVACEALCTAERLDQLGLQQNTPLPKVLDKSINEKSTEEELQGLQ